LYLAKAHFGLKEFERCANVLGDATQIWPDDLLLRYNLAVCLESFGVHLVSMEKKTKRVVGVDSGMDQMTRAVELLGSAARLYGFVHMRWSELADSERKRLAQASGAPANLLEEMKRVGLHKEYCADITTRAQEELANLTKTRSEINARMSQIAAQKLEKERNQFESQAVEKRKDEERRMEMEEQAIHIMDSTKDIVLGRNLGELKEVKEKQKQALTLKSGLPKPLPDKKERHSKKDKKDKKARKEERKRGREGGEESEGGGGHDTGGQDADGQDAGVEEALFGTDEPLQAEQVLPIADEEGREDTREDEALEKKKKEKKKDKDKKEEKKDKKDKRDKKDKTEKAGKAEKEGKAEKKAKKDKKDKKRRRLESGSAEDSGVAGRTDEDKAMEEDLFGPDQE